MKKLLNAILLGLIFLSVACSGVLDIEPTDIIDNDKAITEVKDLESAVLGVYSRLPKATEIRSNALPSDNVKLSETNNGDGNTEYNWAYTADDDLGAWFTYYNALFTANAVLEAIPTLESENNDEDALKRKAEGELLILRAYIHMRLLLNFAEDLHTGVSLGVPIMTKVEEGSPSRNTVDEVYTQIITDAENGKALLQNDQTDITRLTSLAANAIQAKAAFYTERWEDAIFYSTEVLKQKPIVSASNYPFMWTSDENEDEVIFKFKQIGVGGVFELSSGFPKFTASLDLVNIYDLNDVRRDATVVLQQGEYFVNKYRRTDSNSPLSSDVKVFRSSELLLMRAEAYYNQGDESDALDDLNTLRSERIIGFLGGTESGGALEFAIALERRKELAFEGVRFSDFSRTNTTIIRGDVAPFSPDQLSSTDKRMRFPIPQAELFANENMEQNPKWTN
ncbi:RagB/SusD family nutrient uptake outer membrane protein [Sediminitomix flava]|uniref:SusD-like starch-binding protein associating with outer membrane n=1 Tax=Sediminitomix flava TaxID=379075 RepID=A0A315ZAZ1_SEDFL|nr:RagB/SusD family nutrient uptake outer membrane protein [Sediminitomix flava]PWJ42745.1 SusD-like starch-binding protein associating with outer membrane [Sediminitomix flava]